MKPRLAIALLVALAAAPPAYAALVFAWQLSDVLARSVGFAAGAEVPADFWIEVTLLALRLIGVCVALFVVARTTLKARWAIAGLALLGAWGISGPVLLLLLDLR